MSAMPPESVTVVEDPGFDPSTVDAAMSTEETADAPREPGKVETRVRQDIESIGGLDKGFRASMAEIALALARALDRADEEEDIGKIAQVSLQLRQTLGSMADIGEDADAAKEIFAYMATPVLQCERCGKMCVGESR